MRDLSLGSTFSGWGMEGAGPHIDAAVRSLAAPPAFCSQPQRSETYTRDCGHTSRNTAIRPQTHCQLWVLSTHPGIWQLPGPATELFLSGFRGSSHRSCESSLCTRASAILKVHLLQDSFPNRSFVFWPQFGGPWLLSVPVSELLGPSQV